MCKSFLCQELARWIQANPTAMYIGAVFVLAVLFRLATRGRWLTICAVIAIWAIVARIVIWA